MKVKCPNCNKLMFKFKDESDRSIGGCKRRIVSYKCNCSNETLDVEQTDVSHTKYYYKNLFICKVSEYSERVLFNPSINWNPILFITGTINARKAAEWFKKYYKMKAFI